MNNFLERTVEKKLLNMNKEIEIPEGYKARIDGNKVIIELQESDDERVRKNCVHFLKLQKVHLADTSEIDECISYIEKQKEQKPTECDKETDIQKAFREGQNAGRQEVFDNPGAYGLEKIDNVFGFRIGDKVRLVDGDGRTHIIKHFEKIEGLHGPNFYRVLFEDNTASAHIIPGDEYPNIYFTCMEKIDEQKEQMPYEPKNWSADEDNLTQEQNPAELPKSEDYGIDGLYIALDILQTTLGKVAGYQSDDGILEHKCAISAVKELYEQQPASWSEEDKRNFYWISTTIQERHLTPEYTQQVHKILSWLKSLRPPISLEA